MSRRVTDDQPWFQQGGAYIEHVHDPGQDSHYLRSCGLMPTILRMAGDCSSKRLLDVGCANGWLLDALKPAEGYGCDVQRYEEFPDRWDFRECDVRHLPYEDGFFDVIVASLLLVWIAEIDIALAQISRVTKRGARVVIAVMHPHFYRTGEVRADGNFVVTRSLATPFVIDDHRIAGAVGPLRYHYRSPSDYLNACIRSGLTIEEVADWFIDIDQFVARFGTDQPGSIRRTGKVPMFFFIRCRRE